MKTNFKDYIRSLTLKKNKMKYTFNELWSRLPEAVRTATAKCEQNPAYHPEGNVDVHIEMVFDYANDNYFGDNDLLLCALFHDLGKVDTFKIHPKKGVPTSYGHERHAEKYIDKYIHLFADLRPNVERIKEICANHMKAHLYISGSLSKPAKRKAFESLKYFDDIMKFANCDDGGKIPSPQNC